MLNTSISVSESMATFRHRAGFTQFHRELPMWKTADDLKRYAQVIGATAPTLVIETGSRWGGFSAWVRDTFNVPVITVDIEGVTGPGRNWPGVVQIKGSSIDPKVVNVVRSTIAVAGDAGTTPQRVMVVLDSDHHAPHVAEEIKAYGPMVTRGCYLVVEDGLADYVSGEQARRFGRRIPSTGGPLKAIEQELAGSRDWFRDEDIEALTPVSHHPAGWWIRA